MNNKYLHIIRLFRPAQWLKNGFVLLPLFFGGKVLDWECWRSAIPAFFRVLPDGERRILP